MNRLNLGFLFICMLTILTACGGGNGGASLEVSTGALTSSGAFEGGLVIHGKSTTSDDEFLVPLHQKMKTTINIPYGTYKVKVVGWDMTKKFEGSAYCGSSLFNFTQQNPTLTVTPSMVACAGTEFGNSATVGNNFKAFTLKSCGALYDPTAKTQLASPVGHLCDTSRYELSDIERVGSYQVIFKTKVPAGDAAGALVSDCQPEGSTGTLRIPTTVPVSVVLFKDANCTKLIRENIYPQGLAVAGNRTLHTTDSNFQSDTGQNLLLVTSSPSGRGTTPFLTERPGFKCNNTSDCVTARTLTTKTYIVTEGKLSTIFLPDELTCPISITAGSTINSCTLKDKGMLVRVTVPAGTAEIIHGANTYTIQATTFGEVEIYRMLQRSIGMYLTPSNFLTHSLAENNNDEPEYVGVLQTVRDLLGPKYLGGLFWDQTCDPSSPLGTSIVRDIVVNDKGVPETYRATLSNSNKVLPARFNNGVSNVTLHRKLKVQKFVSSVVGYSTEHVVDFACDNLDDIMTGNVQMGRLESSWEDQISSTIKETEKRLVYWNTSVGGTAQIEMYHTDERKESSQVLKLHNRYMQANQISLLTFKVNELEYTAEGSSGVYSETLRNSELDGELFPGTKTVLARRELASLSKQNSTGPGFIYNGVSFQKKRSTIHYNGGTSNSKLQGQVIRRNGKIYQIGYHQNSSNLKFMIKDEMTGDITARDYTLSSVTKIGMAVSASGGFAVGYALQAGAIHYITWKTGDASINWQNFGSMINDTDVAVLDGTGKYVFLTIDNSGLIKQASGEVGLSSPSTETNLSSYGAAGEFYTAVSMTASPSGIHSFIVGDDSGQKKLYHCEMSNSDDNCEKTVVDVDTTASISELEPYFNNSAGKIYINYKTDSAYKLAYLVSAGNFVETPESDFNYQYGLSEHSIDSSTGSSTSPLHIYGEYYNSFENYDMNFNALNPTLFKNHFTGFEN